MIFEILVLLIGIPVGLLIAYFTRDELVAGRKWFKALIIVFVLVGIWSFLTGWNAVGWTSAFVVVVSLVSFVKSFDGKWVKV
jgi:hypothetical protein